MSTVSVVDVKQQSWLGEWFSWTRFSDSMLRAVEKKIFSYLKTPYKGWYVDIGPVVGNADKIWTVSLNQESKKTPLVMLHGLGSGVALWCLNLDAFASNRPVYALDLLGFGRSSRPQFSNDALEAELQMIKAVEEWRREMNLNSFILLGHSMGGFLASSYAIRYPERVQHLVLADPWGFPEKPPEHTRKFSLLIRVVAYALQPFNPLWPIRAAGPLGKWVIDKARPDISRKFATFLKEDEGLIAQYLYQCNSQSPSGEGAFHAMMSSFGWAKHPMVKRISTLDKHVPITLIYGSRTWLDHSASEQIESERSDSYVHVQIINGAGHHVYADRPDIFNKLVLECCNLVDESTKNTSSKATIQESSEKTESDIESDQIKPKLISN